MKNYAYGVLVGGVKRYGGTVHADSMEDAVLRVAKRDKLTIDRKESVYRPFDGAIIPQAEWILEGKRASVYVFAPPEYF